MFGPSSSACAHADTRLISLKYVFVRITGNSRYVLLIINSNKTDFLAASNQHITQAIGLSINQIGDYRLGINICNAEKS